MMDMLNQEKGKDSAGDSPDSVESEDSAREYMDKPRGLVGLQNIGNTCYMNAALQALSNVPPLTRYFLECSQMVQYIPQEDKLGLSHSYLKLINEMWNKTTRGYVIPQAVLMEIRKVHSMFRGYHQHDTQEFLR